MAASGQRWPSAGDQREDPRAAGYYPACLSSRTVVYKGMVLATQLGDYYKDLKDPRFADRGQSIWVGRGRPSKRPLSTAMRAMALVATRATRVASKNTVSDMGSVLRFAPPQTQDQR